MFNVKGRKLHIFFQWIVGPLVQPLDLPQPQCQGQADLRTGDGHPMIPGIRDDPHPSSLRVSQWWVDQDFFREIMAEAKRSSVWS